MTEFWIFSIKLPTVKIKWFHNPLLPRRAAQDLWELSAIGCLSVSEFPIVAHKTEQHRKRAVGGVVYFGYFLLDKQKKVSRQSRESDTLNN
jgi:hypothetical protein